MSNFNNASLIVTPNAVKAGKLYSIKPTNGAGDLDVVRATTATYVGSDGLIKTALANVLRLDYTNGSCPSILVEPQRTNLLLRSQEFDNVNWAKVGGMSITANTTTSPDGTTNADTFTGSGSSNLRFLVQALTVTAGLTYTFSCYVKKNTNDFIQIAFNNGFGLTAFANFDINLGTIGTIGSGTTANITSVDNGWYRCSITATATTSGYQNIPSIVLVNRTTAPLFQTNTLSTSVYIWGAQLEAGSNATSYIPTVASTVTRNADVISKSGLSGITTITETFENGTTNVISGSPTSYTMSQGRIKHVIGI